MLYKGFVDHERYFPKSHHLRYNLYVYALDLDELEQLDRHLPLFGYNRSRPVSLHDGDYLDDGPGTIREKLTARLSQAVDIAAIDRVVMVTSPRLLGHIFNPVSFYYCFDQSGGLLATVAEVNNTYGEKHVYTLQATNGNRYSFPAQFQAEKAFHVSPYNTMGGHYDFTFGDIRRELDICLDLHRDGEHILKASLQGNAHALTPWNHLKTLARNPIMPFLTIPRIYWEAFKLRFKRKLAFHDKPVPSSPMTIRRLPATRIQKFFQGLIQKLLDKADRGSLRVTLPDGKAVAYGNSEGVSPNHLRVNDYRFFSRVALGADIGLGEAFMYDEWDTDDIPGVLGFFINNRPALNDGNLKGALLQRLLEKMRFLARANTLIGSRRNIHEHYDLSNDFFQTFLDDTMAYSCAVFEHPGDDLETAQRNKFRRIIKKLRLQPEDHLLEIGCGWGGFAIEAVRQTGCRVTGITISAEQYDLARERVREAGLEDRIEILFRDYRKMEGQFDKIVSIEMLEAVGHTYYRSFFEQLDRLLKPEGIAVLQSITIPDQRYDAYRKSHDWIQKHIFPGGLLPSLTILAQTMTRHTSLMVEHVENIGDHYAATLAEWHRRFKANQEQVAAMGFDRVFQRKWSYYLGSCEAGFRERVLGTLQLVLTREGNPALNWVKNT